MSGVVHHVDITKANLRTNKERLWHDIHHTARWGVVQDSYGMARLAVSKEDRSVRDWFVGEAKKIGCNVTVDGIGNIFAVLPGINNDIAPIGIGSHLDTQFNGWFSTPFIRDA